MLKLVQSLLFMALVLLWLCLPPSSSVSFLVREAVWYVLRPSLSVYLWVQILHW